MQVLRSLSRTNSLFIIKYAQTGMLNIGASELRRSSGTSTAEGGTPAALDLPPAHTSRGAAIIARNKFAVLFAA